MMDGLPLELHDALQVMTADAESPCLCESRVEELTESELRISWPTDAGERIPISEQQALTISFGRRQTAYAFDAIVVSTVVDPIPLLVGPPFKPAAQFPAPRQFPHAGICARRIDGKSGENGAFQTHQPQPLPCHQDRDRKHQRRRIHHPSQRSCSPRDGIRCHAHPAGRAPTTPGSERKARALHGGPGCGFGIIAFRSGILVYPYPRSRPRPDYPLRFQRPARGTAGRIGKRQKLAMIHSTDG